MEIVLFVSVGAICIAVYNIITFWYGFNCISLTVKYDCAIYYDMFYI